MNRMPAPRAIFDFPPSAFKAKADLVGLHRKQLESRVKDYMIVDSNKPPASIPAPVTPTKTAIHRIEGTAVKRLKASCKPVNGATYLSSYDCIAGLLWRSVMRARSEIKPYIKDGSSRTLCPVDLRGRGVSENYFGNAVTVAKCGPLPVNDLLGPNGQSLAASSIRRAIEKTSVSSLDDVVALGTMMSASERLQFMPPKGLLEEDLMLSNWHFMDTAKFDFGVGPPAAVRMPAMPVPGFAFVFPDCRQHSTSRIYDIYMTLPEDEHNLLCKNEEFRRYFKTFT